MVRLGAIILACLAATGVAKKRVDPKQCEVCIKVLGDIMEGLDKSDRKDQGLVEAAIGGHCKKESLSRQERKLCYLIDPIKRQVSTPITFGMTAEEVCKRKLKKESADICAVKFPVKVDDNTDYSKMRVKHLKQLLADRGVTCNNCLDKSEFVKRAEETRHLDL
mmetsp:Transcript_43718/g.64182  ORF Transcript_43718/g.64182 Transcript_43718/m.64182 type:complete len:164 (-) Transcript_43718:93-584(-)|eukprot:CAMPEP_0195526072 /NCGR_PEP_ID=MMETSP0794_2-20130614/26933_1 /TAXON_ID=515487 /ORGANISM="Stephanopyxis turris, Strain CCMP 815" /LENGTH=163 /DNA_ID=CAMNT_0040656685 /DNA_START=86 /DNA_END=577 /DNA_ORIENTATION=-